MGFSYGTHLEGGPLKTTAVPEIYFNRHAATDQRWSMNTCLATKNELNIHERFPCKSGMNCVSVCQVQALVADGSLTQSEGDALIGKLEEIRI